MSSNLYHAKKDLAYRVKSVPSIGLLNSLGIRNDAIIKVKNKYSLGGPVLLQVDSSEVALGKDIALQIIIQEVFD